MQLNYQMQCCGVHEISMLSSHDSAESAMLSFCKIIYPVQKENDKLWQQAMKNAKAAGANSWDARFSGGFRHGAIYQDVAQYSKFRFAVFTEAIQKDEARTGFPFTYGRKFAAFIKKNKLGSLVETEQHELNPNSGYHVKVFVWGVDHSALAKWYEKNYPKEKSWAERLMSDVIGSAGSAGIPCDPQLPSCGTTVSSAGNVPISNSVCGTQGSSVRTLR
jgi:hypothetical protein